MPTFEFFRSQSKKNNQSTKTKQIPQKKQPITNISHSLQSIEGIQHLHGVLGNQAVGQLLQQNEIIQPKLKVGAANNKYEQQADRIAQRIISGMSGNNNVGERITPIVQRSGEDLTVDITSSFESSLAKSGGQPLPKNIREDFEPKFGQDFSEVRVHDNALSSQLCGEIHANAFAHASNIYFRKGQFQPRTIQGKKLIAHELVHTIQQKRNKFISRAVIQREVLDDLNNQKLSRDPENFKKLLKEYQEKTEPGTFLKITFLKIKKNRKGSILEVDKLFESYIKQLEVLKSVQQDAALNTNVGKKAETIKRLDLLLTKSMAVSTSEIITKLDGWWDRDKHKTDKRNNYVKRFFKLIYDINKNLKLSKEAKEEFFQLQDNVDEKDEVLGEVSERLGDPAEFIDEEFLKEDAGPGVKEDVEIGRTHELELNAVKGLEMAGGGVDAIASFCELISIWKNDPSGVLMKILKSTLPFSKLFSASVQIGDAAEKVHLFNEYQAYDKAGGENNAHEIAIGTAFATDVIDTAKTFAETFYNPIKYIYDRKKDKKKHGEYLEESHHFDIAINTVENATKTAQGAVKAAYGFRAAFEGKSIQDLSDGATGLDIAVQSINLIHNVIDGFSAFKTARNLTRVMYDGLPKGYAEKKDGGFWIFKHKNLVKRDDLEESRKIAKNKKSTNDEKLNAKEKIEKNTKAHVRIEELEELEKKKLLDFDERLELNKLQGAILGRDFKNINKSIGYTKVLDSVQNVIKIIGDALSLNPASAIVGLPIRLAVSISKLARKFYRQYKKGFRKSTQQKTATEDEEKRFKRAKMLVYMAADNGDMRTEVKTVLNDKKLEQKLIQKEIDNLKTSTSSQEIKEKKIKEKNQKIQSLKESIKTQVDRHKEVSTLGKRLEMLIKSIGVNIKALSSSKTPEEVFKKLMDKQKN